MYSVSGQVNYGTEPLAVVPVELRLGSSSGPILATYITDDDGLYEFSSVLPDTAYWVRFNAPSEDFVSWRAQSLTIGDEDLDNGTYYLPKVIALSPPGFPSPADGATVSTYSDYIKLDWKSITEAENYQVQINSTDSWELVEHVWTNSTYPSYNAGTGGSLTDTDAVFETGISYSWQVRAIDSDGHEVGASTAPYSFTVETP